MHEKKGQSKKSRSKLPSEAKPSEILSHEELVHEDRDPIYPFEPLNEGPKQGPGSNKQDAWKAEGKNISKKKIAFRTALRKSIS
jgi:hypothetical protein